MIFAALCLIASAYLVGSIPTAYIVGRWVRGIDLRRYGSGTVSGSMVWEHVARWAIVPVGLFDVAKAALPTWLGVRLGLGTAVAAVAGLAAVIGHNWPLFLNFTGGRGLSTMLGIWLVLYPPAVLWVLASLAIGWLSHWAAWPLLGLLTLPLFASALGGPSVVLYVAAAMLLLTAIKRLEANRRPLPPPGPERRRVILRRLLLDRDIASHQEWIRRRPRGPSADP